MQTYMRNFRIIAAVLGLCLCALAGAQDLQHQKFAQKIKGNRVKMSFAYQSHFNKMDFAGTGEILYLDGSFMLTLGEDSAIVNNRATSWTLDYQNKECVVEKGYAVDLGRSPRQIFELFGQNTKGAEIVTAYRNDDTLSKIEARMKGGNFIKIIITKTEILESLDTGVFSVDTKLLGRDWVITDLR